MINNATMLQTIAPSLSPPSLPSPNASAHSLHTQPYMGKKSQHDSPSSHSPSPSPCSRAVYQHARPSSHSVSTPPPPPLSRALLLHAYPPGPLTLSRPQAPLACQQLLSLSTTLPSISRSPLPSPCSRTPSSSTPSLHLSVCENVSVPA